MKPDRSMEKGWIKDRVYADKPVGATPRVLGHIFVAVVLVGGSD